MIVLNVAIWCCDMPASLHAISNICVCEKERERENDRKKREGACDYLCLSACVCVLDMTHLYVKHDACICATSDMPTCACVAVCVVVCVVVCDTVCVTMYVAVCVSVCVSVCAAVCVAVCVAVYVAVCVAECVAVFDSC